MAVTTDTSSAAVVRPFTVEIPTCRVQDTIERDLDGARRTFDCFTDSGIDYQEIVAVLEREGVGKFANSFSELIDRVADTRQQLVRA